MPINDTELKIRFSNLALEEYQTLKEHYTVRLLETLKSDEGFASVFEKTEVVKLKPKAQLVREAKECLNSQFELVVNLGNSILQFLAKGAMAFNGLVLAISAVLTVGGVVLASCISIIFGILTFAVLVVPFGVLTAGLTTIQISLAKNSNPEMDKNVKKFIMFVENIQSQKDGIKDVKDLEKVMKIGEAVNLVKEDPNLLEVEESRAILGVLSVIESKISNYNEENISMLKMDVFGNLCPDYMAYQVSESGSVMESVSIDNDSTDLFMTLENVVSQPLLSGKGLLNGVIAVTTDTCNRKTVLEFLDRYKNTVLYEMSNEKYYDLPIVTETKLALEYVQERCSDLPEVMETCEDLRGLLEEIIEECKNTVMESETFETKLKKKDVLRYLKNFKYPPSEYWISYKTSLMFHGLVDECNDIDLYITPKLGKRLIKDGYTPEAPDPNFSEQRIVINDRLECFVRDKKPAVEYIDGYQICTLEATLDDYMVLWEKLHREKDIRTIEILKAAIAEKNNGTYPVKEEASQFNPDPFGLGSLTPFPVASRAVGGLLCDMMNAEDDDQIYESMIRFNAISSVINESYYVDVTEDGSEFLVVREGLGKAARKAETKVNQKFSVTAMKDKTNNVKTAVKKTVDPMEKFVQDQYNKLKEMDANERRAIIVSGKMEGTLRRILRWIKRGIVLAAGAAVGTVIPAAAVITGITFVGMVATDKYLDSKEKNIILRELEDEIQICNEKIDDSRGDDNKQKKYELMRIRNSLERQRDKIKYNLRYKADEIK